MLFRTRDVAQLVEVSPNMVTALGFIPIPYKKLGVVVHAYNPNIQKSETGGLLNVQSQPGLCSEHHSKQCLPV